MQKSFFRCVPPISVKG